MEHPVRHLTLDVQPPVRRSPDRILVLLANGLLGGTLLLLPAFVFVMSEL